MELTNWRKLTESKYFFPTVGITSALVAIKLSMNLFKKKTVVPKALLDPKPKKILVIGANSPSGQWFIIQALNRNHQVLATTTGNPENVKKNFEEKFVIPENFKNNVKYGKANVVTKEGLLDALEGQDVIIFIVGPGFGWNMKIKNGDVFGIGSKNIIDCIEELKNKGKNYPKRIIFIDGVITLYSDEILASRAKLGKITRKVIIPYIFGPIFQAKDELNKAFKRGEALGVNWTRIAAPALTNGPLTGNYRVDLDKCLISPNTLSRADLGHYMVTIMDDQKTFNKCPCVAY